ncbi:dATP/dGTP pyrophosphohydrolase domain-containing protein [Pseudomonas aeruginosa]|uniref:dATP/dGTP pyrophosphohydrolase domain-containing protein n=1 Tax=Pseudomonas aeruginosa TaxID=287 RepID=UPI002101279D|nr:dATP/dGTP pyrophosphohydrolase domain-containing protein [Pseudomonas aeruginosa]
MCEIEEAPGNLAEWMDVVILALDGAWCTSATPAQIIDAPLAKQAKNEAVEENTYFVMRNGRWRRVHEARPILVSQGALTQDWGKNWKRIKADFIEQARQIGEELLP